MLLLLLLLLVVAVARGGMGMGGPPAGRDLAGHPLPPTSAHTAAAANKGDLRQYHNTVDGGEGG